MSTVPTIPIPIVGAITDITVGPSQIFTAPYGTTIPNFTGAVTDFGSPFVEPGFTDDGVELDYSPTWKDIYVDELLGPAMKVLDRHKLMVNSKLAEANLQNLTLAVAASTLQAANIMSIGSPQVVPEFVLGFIGPGPRGTGLLGIREGIIFRCVSIGALKMHYRRNDKVIYAVQLEALADPTQPALQDLCIFQDF